MNKYIQVLKVGDFDNNYTYRKPQMTLKNNLQRAAYDGFFSGGVLRVGENCPVTAEGNHGIMRSMNFQN